MKSLDAFAYGKLTGSIGASAKYCFEGQDSRCFIVRGDTIFVITDMGVRFEGKVTGVDLDNDIIYLTDRDVYIYSIIFLGRID